MQHAGAEALDRLGALLARLRTRTTLREKRPGRCFGLQGPGEES